MPAIIYLLLGCFCAYHFLKRSLPFLFQIPETKSLSGEKIPLAHPVITCPAAFLLGTMAITWVTYAAAYLCRFTGKPLFYGNLISFLLFGSLAAVLYRRHARARHKTRRFTAPGWKTAVLRTAGLLWSTYRLEVIFLLIVTAVACFMMFYTFHIKDDTTYVGFSVFSDFGPHLAVIRSFSYGSNFPTEYPHFADGRARYHFLFQFLAGNLEYLGLRLDWAFNLPSILSLVAFFLLFYALAVVITGKKGAGVLAAVLFFFRSSFAFFTYLAGLGPGANPVRTILGTNFFIGRTRHEDWGLWAQNVYVNQRHLAFALGILILTIILVLPLYQSMLRKLAGAKDSGPARARAKRALVEFAGTRDAWLPRDMKTPVITGLMLGLLSFWNGAVVIAAMVILFCFACFSRRRLEYLLIALLTAAVSYGLSLFFIGKGDSAVSFRWSVGFLAAAPNLKAIAAYYLELLGILPFVLAAALLTAPKGSRLPAAAFFSPLVLATTVQLTPDMPVNHKYVIISVLLLNIYVAGFLHRLFTTGRVTAVSRPVPDRARQPGEGEGQDGPVERYDGGKIKKVSGKVTAVILLLLLTITGVVDLITLYNRNHPAGWALKYPTDDPVLLWVKENTGPNELFLTDTYCIHPILLAGRKIFYGWPYFAWSAGYDTYTRERIIARIYGARDSGRLRELVESNKISYIVIEDGNRTSDRYTLNEQLIRDTFRLVYENYDCRLAIFCTY